MITKIIVVLLVAFIVALQGTLSGFVPNLSNYIPDDQGLQLVQNIKMSWIHFSPKEDLSASVSEYVPGTGTGCVRVVVFMGQGGAMEDVKVSCELTDPFIGLVQVGERLWYYGTSFVARLGKKSSDEISYNNKFIVVKATEDMQTCHKTWWIINQNCKEEKYKWRCPQRAVAKSPNIVKINEDEDCKVVSNQDSFPVMIIYSPDGDVGQMQPTGEWSSFNPWEAVGAKIRVYSKGAECYQLLVLTSYGRPLEEMKVSCGRLVGVSMANKAFYYGRTVMVKIHDDSDTFSVIYNPRHGKEKGAKYTSHSICIIKTFRLIKDNERYIKRKISTVVEYDFGPDCQELITGSFQTSTWLGLEEIGKLSTSLMEDIPKVDPEIIPKLTGYTNLKKFDDFNTVNEMGTIIMQFKKGMTDKVKLVLALVRGVVLTSAIVPLDKKPSFLVIREDVLIYNCDLMIRKSAADKFVVIINNGLAKCLIITYDLKSSDGKVVKQEISRNTVEKTNDGDCKNLLDGTLEVNPEAKKYNTDVGKKDAKQ